MVQTRSKTKKHEENPDGENKCTTMNLNVEVVQKDNSNLVRLKIEQEVEQFLRGKEFISMGSKITQFGQIANLLFTLPD